MVSTDNTLFYIAHISQTSEARQKNYDTIYERLLAVLPELDSTTIHLKSLDDLSAAQSVFPGLKLKQTIHPHLLYPTGEALVSGSGELYENAPFPRWSGEIGLLLSVYKACTRLLASDKENLLWLEDDTTLSGNFESLLPFHLSLIDFDFDFVSLSVLDYQRSFYESNPDFFNTGHDIYCRAYQLHWAGAVLISRRGAAKFLALAEAYGFEYPFDWLIYNIRSDAAPRERFDSFTLKPWVFSAFDMDYVISPDSTIYYTHTFSSEDFMGESES